MKNSDAWRTKINTIEKSIPKIEIKKNDIPIVYLDTCIMIEFAKYEQGRCTNEHKQEIGKIYDLLILLMRNNKILCPLGNQMIEMGVSLPRERARNFLYNFTNMQFREPYFVEKTQIDIGYQAFLKEETIIDFCSSSYIEEDKYSNSSIQVNVTPIYKQHKLEEMKEEKKRIVHLQNKAKTDKNVATNLEQQLEAELQADLVVLKYIFEHVFDSIESHSLFIDTARLILERNLCEPNIYNPELVQAVQKYNCFLQSLYHHKLPYIWIQSVLWAYRMQSPDRIVDGDNLDTVWASAYLPFINYAVTDYNFCTLLQTTGLSTKYSTQVYSMKTLEKFIGDMETLL